MGPKWHSDLRYLAGHGVEGALVAKALVGSGNEPCDERVGGVHGPDVATFEGFDRPRGYLGDAVDHLEVHEAVLGAFYVVRGRVRGPA